MMFFLLNYGIQSLSDMKHILVVVVVGLKFS